MSGPHGLRFCGSKFWVTHRRREYGPFDYEWSKDFCGVEFVYRGEKFGEYCSADEIFADLQQFKLPMRVVEVTSVVLGSVIYSVLNGLSQIERDQFVNERLRTFGFDQFLPVQDEEFGSD